MGHIVQILFSEYCQYPPHVFLVKRPVVDRDFIVNPLHLHSKTGFGFFHCGICIVFTTPSRILHQIHVRFLTEVTFYTQKIFPKYSFTLTFICILQLFLRCSPFLWKAANDILFCHKWTESLILGLSYLLSSRDHMQNHLSVWTLELIGMDFEVCELAP